MLTWFLRTYAQFFQVNIPTNFYFIIETCVCLFLFKPLGKKHVPPITIRDLPAFGKVSQIISKEENSEMLIVEKPNQQFFHTYSILRR